MPEHQTKLLLGHPKSWGDRGLGVRGGRACVMLTWRGCLVGPESGSWSARLEGPEQNSCYEAVLWAATLPPSRNPPYVVGYECGDGARIRLRLRPGIWFGHCPADLVPGGSGSRPTFSWVALKLPWSAAGEATNKGEVHGRSWLGGILIVPLVRDPERGCRSKGRSS